MHKYVIYMLKNALYVKYALDKYAIMHSYAFICIHMHKICKYV